MSEPLRVMLVDDHPVYRDGLRLTLDGWDGGVIVGEAADGDTAVALSRELHPDVVLMDLQMPGRSGVDATRDIVAADPSVSVLVLTMFGEDDLVMAALRAGARGYLLKDATGEELRRAIAAAGAGQSVFGGPVASRLASILAESGRPRPFPDLSAREHDVLELMAQGRSNTDIARRLGISEKTVRNLVSIIFAKLAVLGRSEAIVRAREAGMGGESRPG